MGTRNLTAVILDGQYRVAQYGQWDGYPSGQGATILDFLHNTNLNEVRSAVRECEFLTEDDIKYIDDNHEDDWKEVYPHLSRNVGGEILQMVMDGARNLLDSMSFAGDSLFCEYGYVIDLDKNVLEVYKGFNKDGPVTEGRFLSSDETLDKPNNANYGPIKIVKSYDLLNLPTEEKFIDDLKEDEDED